MECIGVGSVLRFLGHSYKEMRPAGVKGDNKGITQLDHKIQSGFTMLGLHLKSVRIEHYPHVLLMIPRSSVALGSDQSESFEEPRCLRDKLIR